MKAILCREYGSVDELALCDVDVPRAGPRDVVIRAEKIGVNFPDGLLVKGLYQAKPALPFVPGMEVVGEVVETGSDVTGFRIGDRVGAVVATGGYAELVRADEQSAFPVSPDADAAEITALMCGYGTAHHALKQRAGLKAGETLVVTGASGLTGLAAVQIGKAMGARVIAVASTAQKRSKAMESGASMAVGYEALASTIKNATDGKGANVIFEVVGGEVFDACARAVAWNGRLLVVGFASGHIPQFPVNLALVKGYSLVGVFWGTFMKRERDSWMDNLRESLDWYAAGKLRPHVETDFPLAKAVDALELIQSRQAVGKVVLSP